MTDERAAPVPGFPEPIGLALWHLVKAREWTLRWIEGITQDALDLTPTGHRHSVATLLYHIAVFEVEWVYTDILGTDYDMERRIPGCPPEIADLLPYPMVLPGHIYTPVEGETVATHIARLDSIRQDLLTVFGRMDVDEFRRPRPSDDGTATPEWILMHLARHESEHRGQIWEARMASERQLDRSE